MTSPVLRRLHGYLPPGTVAVGAGLAVLGAAAYVHLAVAGHVLDTEGMSTVSVLWSIVFALGPGLFMPIEQEITRLVATRTARGEAAGPVIVRGAALCGAVLLALVLVLAAASGPIADRLFLGDTAMVWILAGALAALAVAHTTRGILAGLGRFRGYGVQLAVDGALRMGLAALLGVLGVASPAWFSLILVLAPLVSVLVTLPAIRPPGGTSAPVALPDLVQGLGLLTVSALLAQLIVNVAVVNVRLLAPADVAVAGALLSALVLVRVPIFVFASLQASLLPSLSAAVASHDLGRYRQLLRRAVGLVSALALTGGAVAIAVGPQLIQVLFDAEDVLGRIDFALLAAGTLGYLLALVLGQGVLALGRHRNQTFAWITGTVTLWAITALPIAATQRVELAYAAGALVVAAQLAFVLRHKIRRPPLVASAVAPAAIHLGGTS